MRRGLYLSNLLSKGIISHHEEPVLLPGKFRSFRLVSRPGKGSAFQPLIKEKKAVSFPEEPFDPIRPAPAEQEEDILFQRIQLIVRADELRKSIDPFSKVCVSACDNDLMDVISFSEHHEPPSGSPGEVPEKSCWRSPPCFLRCE